MSTSLAILIVESHPGAGADDAAKLAAAGHRVLGCYREAAAAGRRSDLCSAVTEGACPIDERVDVAVLVRRRLWAHPGAREAGVSCALRAGVPVVEHGPDLLDPFEPWLSGRVGGNVVAACEEAARHRFDALLGEVRSRTASLLSAAGVAPDAVRYGVEMEGTGLRVVMEGPPIERRVVQGLAVRVLDALRSSTRTWGQVSVSYRTDGSGGGD